DSGNIEGYFHNHRFVAANTAIPYANGDETQLKDTENFLKNGQVRVDIFAISPDKAASKPQLNLGQPEIETTFAVGEEQAIAAPSTKAPSAPPQPVTAPLNRVNPAV